MSWRAKLPPAARVPKREQGHEEPVPPPANIEENDISDGEASNHGHGTDETLRVTQILEEHGISNCLVGVSALKFYGAARVRDDWEICVPTGQIVEARAVLLSPPYSSEYRLLKPWPHPTPGSLNYTYERFKSKGKDHYFVLVPSEDAHIVISPDNLTRSIRGFPYPKLEVFIQSCLDRAEKLELEDGIDGSNVSEQWGEEFLDLEGTNDTNWAERMHQKGVEFAKGDHDLEGWIYFRTAEFSKRELWQEAVRNKKRRMGWDKPSDIFVTQYRAIGSPDPWLEDSDM